jgi:hypothetical protein
MKVKIKRNKHNLSHFKLGTCFPGELVPVGCVEVCPGDTFRHQVSSFVRMLPMNAPLMQNAQVRLHSFFVPFRIIWDGFEEFITRQDGALGPDKFDLDEFTSAPASIRLADYLGADVTGFSASSSIIKLPFSAYNAIYNEWYRDQDLVTIANTDPLTLGMSDCIIRRISWQKDYFTASRPWPQKGADVSLPLGTEAPLVFPGSIGNSAYPYVDSAEVIVGGTRQQLSQGSGSVNVTGTDSGLSQLYAHDVLPPPYADLTTATAATVNTVRRAFELQRLAERLAQFGSRYPEYLASMGIKSSDARLQRPEYLGGGKVNISFSEVLQTAEGSTTPVGELRGHAISPGSTAPYKRFFEEHGYVMTLMSIRPQAIYSKLIPRMFLHGLVDGANDFYTPELERIGQQAILNGEVYNANDGQDLDVFAYNDRYAEYRHQFSQVCADLKVGSPLDYWTWARGFSSRPALNQTFIECDPSARVFADQVQAPVVYGVNHKLIAYRMLTKNVIGGI